MSPISTKRHGDVLIVLANNPPVNALSAAVRAGLVRAVGEAGADEGVKAVVIACAGQTFFAGADIGEFGKPPVEPLLPAGSAATMPRHSAIERQPSAATRASAWSRSASGQSMPAALNAAGYRVSLMPAEGADSESLLSLPQLAGTLLHAPLQPLVNVHVVQRNRQLAGDKHDHVERAGGEDAGLHAV